MTLTGILTCQHTLCQNRLLVPVAEPPPHHAAIKWSSGLKFVQSCESNTKKKTEHWLRSASRSKEPLKWVKKAIAAFIKLLKFSRIIHKIKCTKTGNVAQWQRVGLLIRNPRVQSPRGAGLRTVFCLRVSTWADLFVHDPPSCVIRISWKMFLIWLFHVFLAVHFGVCACVLFIKYNIIISVDIKKLE